jgi:hypothetical protein
MMLLLFQGQAEELFKRQSVVDLVFQFGIGFDAESLLEHQAFKEQQRRIGIGAFRAGSNRVMAYLDRINSAPIDRLGNLIHEFKAAIVLEGTGECEISKG